MYVARCVIAIASILRKQRRQEGMKIGSQSLMIVHASIVRLIDWYKEE